MLRRKRRFPLPKFPPKIKEVFRALCEERGEDFVELARAELAEVVANKRVAMEGKSAFAFRLLEELALRAEELLLEFPSRPRSERRLIVGALRYFSASVDPIADEVFETGLFDDVAVMNYVLEELNLTSFIETS